MSASAREPKPQASDLRAERRGMGFGNMVNSFGLIVFDNPQYAGAEPRYYGNAVHVHIHWIPEPHADVVVFRRIEQSIKAIKIRFGLCVRDRFPCVSLRFAFCWPLE